MKTHFHYGRGIAGYGPEEPLLCHSLPDLAYAVRESLDDVAQGWADQAHGERYLIEQLKKDRPANGSEPAGYPGSWESIATAALRALECLDEVEAAENLAFNLRAERQQAPAYRGNEPAWEAELRRMLLESGTYPLVTDITGNHRFYVWECTEWRCLLNEHDTDATSAEGGYVPCACRDCMEILVWPQSSGEAPYCHACAEADCPDREHPQCQVDPDL